MVAVKLRGTPQKYRNKVVRDADGKVFHSKAELERWRELLILQAAGVISELRRQVPITLRLGSCGAPIRYDNGHAAKLVVDFVYKRDGRTVYEDSKGFEPQLSRLKRAIARAMGIEVVLHR